MRALGGALLALLAAPAGAAAAESHGAIRHIVVLLQENHSFDNVLGYWCATTGRCDGTRYGFADGRRFALTHSPDLVPASAHGTAAHATAVDGGAMDGFARLSGCGAAARFACYSQYRPADIPNLTRVAARFTVGDRIFEARAVSSWGSHLEVVSGTLDGFRGDTPLNVGSWPHLGWGCDSGMRTWWHPSASAPWRLEPSCVPFPDGSGADRPSPVRWVPTIMDRLDAAGLTWRLYARVADMELDTNADGGYGWDICATFADCLRTEQHLNNVPLFNVIGDARAGRLPNFAIVTPTSHLSQHGYFSMREGDNYIGHVLAALMHGPQWRSTAVIVTYDDFGGLYDHVPPPAGSTTIRLPFVIVSPWARPRFTDHHVGSLSSVLAFVEHTFGVQPLTPDDAHAYDLRGAFDFHQRPVGPIAMTTRPLSPGERAYIDAHPPPLGVVS